MMEEAEDVGKLGFEESVLMRNWGKLGIVDTIYEEDQGSDFASLSSQSSRCCTSSPDDDLQNLVDSWSRATGCKPDVFVRVQDQCFLLHRGPLMSKSAYLRRRLTESSDITVTTPSSLTAEEFAAVARHCYGSEIHLTPANFVAVRIAAEKLEMCGTDNLLARTEEFIDRHVAGDSENAARVLRACTVRPLEGAAAEIAGRCVAALVAAAGSEDGGDDEAWLDDVARLSAEEFRMVTQSMRAQSACDHDSLYRLVDYYIQNYHQGKKKLTEEEKSLICAAGVDTSKLSAAAMADLVQNPRLPLRFVVQSMLLHQLRTRRSFFSTAASSKPLRRGVAPGMTLGAILNRDATLRQATHIRATMEATADKICSLERELADMRLALQRSTEEQMKLKELPKLGKPRSESFRIVRSCEPLSSSDSLAARSESFRFVRHAFDEEDDDDVVTPVAATTEVAGNKKAVGRRSLGKKLMRGLKSVFRTSTKQAAAELSSGEGDDGGGA